jgi:phage-related minor tail protein
MEFARNQSFSAQFNLEGFAPQSVDVATQIAGAGAAGMAGNLLLGGIVGAAVDASTGAANEHVPNPVFVDFMQIVSEPPIPGLASPSGTVVDGPASTPVS